MANEAGIMGLSVGEVLGPRLPKVRGPRTTGDVNRSRGCQGYGSGGWWGDVPRSSQGQGSSTCYGCEHSSWQGYGLRSTRCGSRSSRGCGSRSYQGYEPMPCWGYELMIFWGSGPKRCWGSGPMSWWGCGQRSWQYHRLHSYEPWSCRGYGTRNL